MNTTESSRSIPQKNIGRSPVVPVLGSLVLGAAITALWLHHPAPTGETGKPGLELSPATKNVLATLPAPVSIRYFDLLPADSVDPSLPAFASRVSGLLNALQAASGNKLQLITVDNPAETNATAASAAGLQPFNLDKGQACFLGLTLTSGKHQETFARLQTDWEPALEFDLARAIARVAIPEPPAPVAPEVAKPAPEMVASIRQLIPDVSATSEETANQIFHAEFMKELGDASTAMDAQMTAAQQQVTQAEASGSAAELEAARKNLAQVQVAQAAKIRQLAADLKTRQAVFQSLKNGTK